jgi:hypothetical protein
LEGVVLGGRIGVEEDEREDDLSRAVVDVEDSVVIDLAVTEREDSVVIDEAALVVGDGADLGVTDRVVEEEGRGRVVEVPEVVSATGRLIWVKHSLFSGASGHVWVEVI